jgi:hypothetical protein
LFFLFLSFIVDRIPIGSRRVAFRHIDINIFGVASTLVIVVVGMTIRAT